MKPSELLDVLEKRAETVTSPRDVAAEVLFTLIAHLFWADQALDGQELGLIRKLVPDVPDANAYLQGLRRRSLDLDALARAYPDPDDRRDIVALIEHAMWADDRIDEREWTLIERVAEVLDVHRGRLSEMDLG